MITKNDCLSILVNLEKKGVNINTPMKQLITSKEIPEEVLKFIVKNNGLAVTDFYEMLRTKHNKNKSPIYTNIFKENKDKNEVIITLSSILQQITLFNANLEEAEKSKFLREVRAEEIIRALDEYFKTDSIEIGLNLLNAIKRDLMVLEFLADKRELA